MPSTANSPFVDKARLLASVQLPSIDADDNALEDLLCELRVVRDAFEKADTYGDIKIAQAAAPDLSAVERRFADLRNHIAFLESKASQDSSTFHLAKKILATSDNIEASLSKSREQVDVALEWFELSGPVMLEMNAVADECQTLLSDIQVYGSILCNSIFSNSADHSIVDGLVDSLKQSPIPGHGKLITLSDEDREQNAKLITLTKKLQPLRISLDFLDSRISKLTDRLSQYFPTALDELNIMRQKLDAKCKKLVHDTDMARRELGEDRWIHLLKDVGNQIRRSMSDIESAIDCLEDVAPYGEGSPSGNRKIKAYEARMAELVPEVVKLLGLISKAVDDQVTISGDIKRDYMHFKNFWQDIEERIGEMDQKYGLDFSTRANVDRGRQSRSSLRSSVSSNTASAFEFNFRGSRSRSTSSAYSAVEPASPLDRSLSSSPFDEDPDMQTPTSRKLYITEPLTPTQNVKRSANDMQSRSLPRVNHYRSFHQLPSAIPVRRNNRDIPDDRAPNATLPRARTPSGSQAEFKRRSSGIPQPKFTPLKSDVPPVPPVPSIPHVPSAHPASSISRPQSSHELRRKPSTIIPKTPTRKPSHAQLLSSRKAQENKAETQLDGVKGSARKSLGLLPPPATPHYTTKTLTAMAKEQGAVGSALRTPKVGGVSAKDPFGPTASTTLNHHASTPNLSQLVRKQSRANLVNGEKSSKKAEVPPVPAVPALPKQDSAKLTYTLAPAGLSPESQQKYYITYKGATDSAREFSGTAPNGLSTPLAASPLKPSSQARKSLNPVIKEKPRWR